MMVLDENLGDHLSYHISSHLIRGEDESLNYISWLSLQLQLLLKTTNADLMVDQGKSGDKLIIQINHLGTTNVCK